MQVRMLHVQVRMFPWLAAESTSWKVKCWLSDLVSVILEEAPQSNALDRQAAGGINPHSNLPEPQKGLRTTMHVFRVSYLARVLCEAKAGCPL